MISDRARGLSHATLLCQCIVVTAMFWLWYLLGSEYRPFQNVTVWRYLVYNEFILLGIISGYYSSHQSVLFLRPNFNQANRMAFRQILSGMFYLLLYLVAIQDRSISRVFLFTLIPLLYPVLFFCNRYLPVFLGQWSFRRDEENVLLVGPADKASALQKWVEENRELGMSIAGCLSDTNGGGEKLGPKVLGGTKDLQRVLDTESITKVILVEFPWSGEYFRNISQVCEERGIRLLAISDLAQSLGTPIVIFEDRGMFFMGLRHEPLESPINRFLKRCLDIAVSLTMVLFVLPPLTVFVWICQRLHSSGPLLYRQVREGFHKKPFEILKYRTMHVGDPANVELPTSTDDPRLFPASAFLRRTSLDEMPQFWNVLRGEMSVVGPRPHMLFHTLQYQRVFGKAYVRNFVKPGITGLAQARGFRGDTKTAEEVVHRMQSDIEYLENWSFWLDCALILRTALHVVIPPKRAL